jgi:ribosomal protein L13
MAILGMLPHTNLVHDDEEINNIYAGAEHINMQLKTLKPST